MVIVGNKEGLLEVRTQDSGDCLGTAFQAVIFL
jgi:hypothetical protein